MAAVASFLELAAVWVVGRMTTAAVSAELLLGDVGRVTGVAVKLGMRAEQCVLCLREMVVLEAAPAVIAVAVVALVAESTGVRIICPVATDAGILNLVLKAPARVAAATLERTVPPEQREARLLGVIELRGLPVCLRVALGAILAARTTVHVIRHVTGYTACRCPVVLAANVTGIAAHFAVRAL